MYRLTLDASVVQRLDDGACIPAHEGNADYRAYLAWIADGGVPAPYTPPPPAVPHEVPRWAGRLALKRHVLQSGELVLLPPGEASEENLLASVLGWRATLSPGELADRVDAALDDAKDWLRQSETVAVLAAVLGLADKHVDQLFFWADDQEV